MDDYNRFLRSHVGHALLLAPVAGTVVRDKQGHILLQRRADDGTWGIPGGWLSPGESVLECARREALEETGWAVEVTGLLGLYTDPATRTHTYPSGDQAQFVAMVFEGRAVERVTEHTDGEALEMAFFPPDALPEPLNPFDRQPLADATSGEARPFLR